MIYNDCKIPRQESLYIAEVKKRIDTHDLGDGRPRSRRVKAHLKEAEALLRPVSESIGSPKLMELGCREDS